MNPLEALIDLFLPRECHVCGVRLLEDEEYICNDCCSKLPVTGYEKYWLNRTAPNSDLNPMEQRFAGQIPLKRACAPFFYTRDSSLASLVHDFKYRGFSKLAVTLGRLGATTLKDTELFDGVDILLPIPIHWRKRMKRGYNQSEMIARGVSQATGIPVGKQLQARKHHRTQTSLTSEQRRTNTKGIFWVENPSTLQGKGIMLIDDICTTGATLLSAAETVAASVSDADLSLFAIGVV